MTRRTTSTVVAAMELHPWRTLAGAFLAGAAIALDAAPRRRVASKLGTMGRAMALDVLRDLALVGVLQVLATLTRTGSDDAPRSPMHPPAPDEPVVADGARAVRNPLWRWRRH